MSLTTINNRSERTLDKLNRGFFLNGIDLLSQFRDCVWSVERDGIGDDPQVKSELDDAYHRINRLLHQRNVKQKHLHALSKRLDRLEKTITSSAADTMGKSTRALQKNDAQKYTRDNHRQTLVRAQRAASRRANSLRHEIELKQEALRQAEDAEATAIRQIELHDSPVAA